MRNVFDWGCRENPNTYCSLASPETASFMGYFLTPYFTVLLEKVTGLQLVKKFPAFYGT